MWAWKEVRVPVDGKRRSLKQETVARDGGRYTILLTGELDMPSAFELVPSWPITCLAHPS